MTAYKLVDKSCFINVSARLDPIEGYRGEEGPPPKLLSSRGFRGFRGSRPPLQIFYLEADNVWVLQLLEQGDLPDGGGGHALLLRLQSDLLHGHDLASLLVAPLESQVDIS